MLRQWPLATGYVMRIRCALARHDLIEILSVCTDICEVFSAYVGHQPCSAAWHDTTSARYLLLAVTPALSADIDAMMTI